MPKPSTVFVWATDANYGAGAFSWSSTANKTAPVAGLIAEGWEPTEHPTAQNLNWNLNLIGQWITYFDLGTYDGNWTVNGNLTVTGTSTLTGNITAGADITVTGKIKFTGDRVMVIPAAAANPPPGGSAWTYAQGEWTVGDTTYLDYPVVVEDGYRITHFAAYANKATNSGITLSAQLIRVNNSDGTLTVVGTATSNANAPGNIPLLQTVNHTVVITDAYFIRCTSDTGPTVDKFRGVEIQYDRPS